MFLCLLNVLLRYNVASGEESIRKRNCDRKKSFQNYRASCEGMLKPLRPKGQWSKTWSS